MMAVMYRNRYQVQKNNLLTCDEKTGNPARRCRFIFLFKCEIQPLKFKTYGEKCVLLADNAITVISNAVAEVLWQKMVKLPGSS